MRKIIWKKLATSRQQTNVARTELSGNLEVPAHDHDFPEVFWLESGSIEHELNGVKTILHKNSLALIKPEDIHSYKSPDGKKCSYMNVAFCPEMLDAFSKRYFSHMTDFWSLSDKEIISMSEVQITFLSSAAEKLAENPDSVFEMDFFILCLLKEIGYKDNPSDFSVCPDWLEAACEKMRMPGNLGGGVKRFNELAGRTPEHVARTLKKSIGMTPLEMINRYRMEYASVQLRMTSKEITDISFECGFESLSHFYRVFKAYFKLSPGKYRKCNKMIRTTGQTDKNYHIR